MSALMTAMTAAAPAATSYFVIITRLWSWQRRMNPARGRRQRAVPSLIHTER
ncbi:hypothetical protein [Mycobacterium intracellulare]|uniref:hypothetical protein n=1 Tax=Mycobacterium intracellulare TaxID=1767 RepID=UPI001445EE55|nr:hypothetical protein [Mycobacterium intracellulare]